MRPEESSEKDEASEKKTEPHPRREREGRERDKIGTEESNMCGRLSCVLGSVVKVEGGGCE